MKGDTCGFLHVFDVARMPVCRQLLKYGVCKEADCPYKHSLDDIKVPASAPCPALSSLTAFRITSAPFEVVSGLGKRRGCGVSCSCDLSVPRTLVLMRATGMMKGLTPDTPALALAERPPRLIVGAGVLRGAWLASL